VTRSLRRRCCRQVPTPRTRIGRLGRQFGLFPVARHHLCARRDAGCARASRARNRAAASDHTHGSGEAASSGQFWPQRGHGTRRGAVDAFCGGQRARCVQVETPESRHPRHGLGRGRHAGHLVGLVSGDLRWRRPSRKTAEASCPGCDCEIAASLGCLSRAVCRGGEDALPGHRPEAGRRLFTLRRCRRQPSEAGEGVCAFGGLRVAP
jgi:hypothetical protein